MGKFKYKLKEAVLKPKDVNPALLKRLEAKYGPIKDTDFFSDTLDTYYKTSNVDPETNSVTHDIIKLASFGDSLKKMSSAVKALKQLMGTEDARNDQSIKDIASELKDVFNKYRTHLRKNYPDQYNQIKSQLEEISTTGGGAGAGSFSTGTGGQYATPFAFNKNKKAKGTERDILTKKYKYKMVNEDLSEKAKIYFLQKLKKGEIDKLPSDPEEEYITQMLRNQLLQQKRKQDAKKVNEEYWDEGYKDKPWTLNNGDEYIGYSASKQVHVVKQQGGDEVEYNEIAMASIYGDDWKDAYIEDKKSIDEGIGSNLGPGPNAGNEGVKDNAYIKQFKYKLVPNKIKRSGLEVKNLFEAEVSSDYQKRRIAAFDEIEQQLNDVYKMLSNAKNETVQYYTDNPSSYAVVKPTDLVKDYINDIKDLLKGEE